MTKHLIALAGVLACSSSLLGAANPQSTPPSQVQPAPSPPLGAIRLSGCLRPWDSSTMGQPPSEKAVPSSVVRDFVLTNAEPVVDREKKLSPDVQAHPTYLLRADTSVQFANHVGHKVEVAGTVAKADPQKPDPERGDSVLKNATPVVLQVVTLEMIATSCP